MMLEQDFKILKSCLKTDLKKIACNKKFSDVMFLVEKQKIPAHKNILAARSEKFEKMFTGNFKESNQQIVEIPKMKAEIFNRKTHSTT